MLNLTNEQLYKLVVAFATFITTVAAVFLMTACSFTRTVSTTGESYARGDTVVHVSTRVVESYHATDNRRRDY